MDSDNKSKQQHLGQSSALGFTFIKNKFFAMIALVKKVAFLFVIKLLLIKLNEEMDIILSNINDNGSKIYSKSKTKTTLQWLQTTQLF